VRLLSRASALTLAGVLALGLAGCSGDEEPAARDGGTEPQSKILQPGQPGEPNQTLDPDTTIAPDEWNDADAAFMAMMIPHHAQALEMARLAQVRAEDDAVRSLARRIEGAQGPEIRSMAAWLAVRGLDVPEGHHGDHGARGGAMPGMLTSGQLRDLRAARGAEFDRLFLAGMIQHHQGAVDMAATELEEGVDTLALEMAGEVSSGQLAEIRRMEDLQRRR
jgi:uncharacterized protein (DUF305 family)